MFEFPKEYKNKFDSSNLNTFLSSITYIIAILTFISLLVGSVVLYSYLDTINQKFLFIGSLNDKLIYAVAFASFFIVIIAVVYSILPFMLFFIEDKSYDNKIIRTHLCNMFLCNMLCFWYLMYYSCVIIGKPIPEWSKITYIINLFPLFLVYIVFVRIRSCILNRISIDYFFNRLISLGLSVIPPCLIFFWGFKIDVVNDEIDVLKFLLGSLLAMLFVGLLFIAKNTYIKVLLILSSVCIWSFFIYKFSPLVMSVIGVNDSLYTSRNINDKEVKGRVIFYTENYIVFLEKGKKYNESILIREQIDKK